MELKTVPNIGRKQPVGYVAEGWVEADNIVTADKEFVAEAETLEDATEIGVLCQQTFDLGVFIRKQATSSAELRSFDERVKRFVEDVTRVTHDAVQSLDGEVGRIIDPDHGVLNEAVDLQLRNLSEAIDRAFDENDKRSALNRVQQAVRAAATDANEQSTRSLRNLLSVSTGDGPLAELRETIVREVSAPFLNLGDSLANVDKLLTAENARRDERMGTHQGIEFEDALAQTLGELREVTGDVVTHTGTEPGPSGSKVGDYVVEIHTGGGAEVRIVLECKKRSTSPSVAQIRKELDEAARNRDAAVAVMVLSSERSAPHDMPLWKLAEHRYVVVYDDLTRDALALRLAFQQARSDALAMLTTRGDADVLDVDALVAKLTEARTLLSHLKQIQAGVTKARAALDTVKEHAVGMQTELLACLDVCDHLAKCDVEVGSR